MLLLFSFCRFYCFTFLPSHFYGVLRSSTSGLGPHFTQPILTTAHKQALQSSACLFHQLLSVVLLSLLATKRIIPEEKWVILASYPSHPFYMHCRNDASLDFIPELLIDTPLLNLISDMMLTFYRHYTYFLGSLHNPSVGSNGGYLCIFNRRNTVALVLLLFHDLPLPRSLLFIPFSYRTPYMLFNKIIYGSPTTQE